MLCQAKAMKKNFPLINQNIVNLAISYQRLSERINRSIDPLELNMTRLSILNHFSWQPEHPHTISELAQTMSMNQPAVTKAVQAMTKQGWIRKQRDKDDARITHLFVTEQGLGQLNAARQACGPLLAEVFAEFTEQELADMNGLLGKLKSQLD